MPWLFSWPLEAALEGPGPLAGAVPAVFANPPRETSKQGFVTGMAFQQLNRVQGLHLLREYLIHILAHMNTFTCKCLNLIACILN